MAKLAELIEHAQAWLANSEHPYLILSATAVAIFVAGWFLSAARQYQRLSHFKGPPSAAWSKWWLLKVVTGGEAYLDFWEVNKKYGPIARIAPNELVTSDPDLMKRVLGARTIYRRSDWYDAMRHNPDKASSLCFHGKDEDKLMRVRSKMAAGYSGKDVENLEPRVDDLFMNFVRLIEGYVKDGKEFDLGRKVQFFSLDLITDLAFGNAMGFVEKDTDLFELIKTTEDGVAMSLMVTVIPWVIDLFRSPGLKRLLPSEKDVMGFGKLMGLAKHYASERYGPNAQVRKDMLGSFVAHGLTQEETEAEILVQVMAGTDTTATAIRATLLHLITNPRVHAKLRAEFDANPWNTPIISDAQARTMPYLQAVVKEGLRIWPPVAALMTKVAPPQGDTFKDIHIPGGTRIGYCGWGIMRDRDTFGDDANEFKPERWIEASPEQLRKMETTLDLVFHAGRYQCLGKAIALMELNKVFPTLLSRFDINIINPTKPWDCTNPGIFFQHDFWVRARPRE